ncbi:hypothetical protein V9T40_012557 [Parthenolecanium corni]|uniref:Major capsid protein n=1 Tax=Parthenolecanium corni TaxID=536013 RepID=A0AAN9XZ83_9HEMI
MAFVHAQSGECMKSELDIFTLPPTQTSIEKSDWVEYKPVSALTDDGPIDFSIPGFGEEYLDLSHTLLYVKVKIVNVNGANLAAPSANAPVNVAPVNNFLHSLFDQVDVFLNQKLVSSSTNNYMYRAYIEALLNYGTDSKNTHLTNALYYPDTSGKMINFATNTGLAKRKLLAAMSAPIELLGPIHCDVMNMEKYLINGVEVKLKFVRTRDSFSVMAAEGNYKVKILDACLKIRKVKINPAILLAHSKNLERFNAKYPITRVETKVATISTGLASFSCNNIIMGQIPKRIIIGFVSNRTYNGDFTNNPYNFEHFQLNHLCLYVDGQQVPSKPLQPDYANNIYSECYNTLFTGTDIFYGNSYNHNITKEDYIGGYTLYAFDLTSDLSASNNGHWNLIRHGSIMVDLKFAVPLAEAVNMILYAEFDNVIEIDKRRNVSIDFGA